MVLIVVLVTIAAIICFGVAAVLARPDNSHRFGWAGCVLLSILLLALILDRTVGGIFK